MSYDILTLKESIAADNAKLEQMKRDGNASSPLFKALKSKFEAEKEALVEANKERANALLRQNQHDIENFNFKKKQETAGIYEKLAASKARGELTPKQKIDLDKDAQALDAQVVNALSSYQEQIKSKKKIDLRRLDSKIPPVAKNFIERIAGVYNNIIQEGGTPPPFENLINKAGTYFQRKNDSEIKAGEGITSEQQNLIDVAKQIQNIPTPKAITATPAPSEDEDTTWNRIAQLLGKKGVKEKLMPQTFSSPVPEVQTRPLHDEAANEAIMSKWLTKGKGVPSETREEFLTRNALMNEPIPAPKNTYGPSGEGPTTESLPVKPSEVGGWMQVTDPKTGKMGKKIYVPTAPGYETSPEFYGEVAKLIKGQYPAKKAATVEKTSDDVLNAYNNSTKGLQILKTQVSDPVQFSKLMGDVGSNPAYMEGLKKYLSSSEEAQNMLRDSLRGKAVLEMYGLSPESKSVSSAVTKEPIQLQESPATSPPIANVVPDNKKTVSLKNLLSPGEAYIGDKPITLSQLMETVYPSKENLFTTDTESSTFAPTNFGTMGNFLGATAEKAGNYLRDFLKGVPETNAQFVLRKKKEEEEKRRKRTLLQQSPYAKLNSLFDESQG
jgi:hypothetical protein